MAADELRFKVTADGADAAAKEVGKVADAVDKLEGTTAKVAVEADDQATPVIEGAQGAVDDLDGTDATVAVEADDEATEPLEGVQGAVDDLDGAGATVTADADDEATQTIEDVDGAVGDLDGASAEVGLEADDQATDTLDEVQNAVEDLDGASAEVQLDADDEASDVVGDVQGAVEDLDGTTAEVTLEAKDEATPALESAKSGLGDISNAASKLPGSFGQLGGAISSLGGGLAGMTAGLSAGIVAIGAAVKDSIDTFQNLGVSVKDFVTQTGTSFEDASRIIEVTGDLGIGIDAVESSIGRMNLQAAKTPKVFSDIGASIARNKDGTLDAKNTFLSVMDALRGIEDAGKRAEAGRAIFGKGWANMAPLIGQSADDLRQRFDSVSDSKIFDEAKANRALAYRDAFDEVGDAVEDLKIKLADDLQPAITGTTPLIASMTEAWGKAVGTLAAWSPPALLSKIPGLFRDGSKLAGTFADSIGNVSGAQEENTKKTEASKKATEGAVKALQDFTDKLALQFIATAKAGDALADLGSAFDQIGLREGVLANVFKLDAGPRDARDEIRTIAEGIQGLGDVAKGVSVGDALSNNLKADKFLDAIDKLAPQIQSAVTKAFGSGGPEAAITMANSYIDQVTAELGGKFSREQVAAMLGLDNIEATIAVAVEQSSLESAKRQLAILVGVGGQTPYTAQIALALEAGTITGEQAQTLIQAKLGDAKVPIPSALAVPQTAEALAGAQAALDAGVPVGLPSKLDPTGAEDGVAEFVDGDHGTVVLPVKPDDGKLKATDRAIDAVATAERTALLMSEAESGTLNTTDRALDGVATQERTALIMAQAESGTLGATAGTINAVANQPRTAQIASQAEAGSLGSTNAALNSVANRDRTADVGSQADPGDLNATNRAIDSVANKPRTATIYVRTTASGVQLGNWTGPGASGTSAMAPTATAEETLVAPTGQVRVSRRRAPTTVNNITNNVIVPRIPSGRELARVAQRWSRVNGKG